MIDVTFLLMIFFLVTTTFERAEGWHRSEGEAYIRINSRGLRDREHSSEPAPQTFRVAVIGDSFTAGLHVDLEEIYW